MYTVPSAEPAASDCTLRHMAAGTREKLETLSGSVGVFKPTDHVSKELAAMYTALLTEVKKEHNDDPVVAAMEPPGEDMIGHPIMDAGTMRAAILQLLGVYD